MKNKILIVEDDSEINNFLKELLELNNYDVLQSYSGTEAMLILENKKVDLIVLDLMIPGMSGKDVIREIRKTSNVPILACSAISDVDTKVDIIKLGADDYITKPFDNNELLARIEARLRLKVLKCGNVIYKNIVLNLDTYEGFIDNQNMNLSKIEFNILKLLIENKEKVFTKNNIYESVWQDSYMGDENIINVHISKIRAKIKKNTNEEYIKTVWGIGFKMS